jgi:hypothetical protein
MRALRILALIGALALGACDNLVRSEEPILTKADSAPEWTLKPGLWTPVGLKGCAFNPVRSVRNWPDCAEVELIESPRLFDLLELDGSAEDFVMAEVDPGLFLLQSTSADPEQWVQYFFVTRNARDGSGYATRVGFGFLECGPAPPAGTKWPDGANRGLTLQLYPGVVADGQDCIPQGREGLFAVARANGQRNAEGLMQWRRAARPDEVAFLKRREERERLAAERNAPFSPPSPSR